MRGILHFSIDFQVTSCKNPMCETPLKRKIQNVTSSLGAVLSFFFLFVFVQGKESKDLLQMVFPVLEKWSAIHLHMDCTRVMLFLYFLIWGNSFQSTFCVFIFLFYIILYNIVLYYTILYYYIIYTILFDYMLLYILKYIITFQILFLCKSNSIS